MSGASTQEPSARARRPRPWAGRIRSWGLALVLVVVAPLLLVELALRLVGPRIASVEPLLYHPALAHRFDSALTLPELLEGTPLGYQPRARVGDFVLNSRSFRAHEYSDRKPAGTLRVLAIGNSFTLSANVAFEDSWPARLEALLEERLARDVEVLNLGVPAVGVEFQLRLWQLEGRELAPDLVVLAFTVGSNFHATVNAQRELTTSDRLAERSYAFRLARNFFRLRASRPEGEPRPTKPDPVRIPEGASGVRVREFLPDFPFPLHPERPSMSEEAFARLQANYLRACAGIGMKAKFEDTARALVALDDAVSSTGAELLVMVCPAELQVNPARLEETLRASPPAREISPQAVLAPQRFLRKLFEREGIRALDLLQAFRDAAVEGPLYGPRDSHWNPAGNALAAEVLADHLTDPLESGERWPWDAAAR